VERVTVPGVTFTEMLSCDVTAAELLTRGSATLTAVTVALGGDGKIVGAAYNPVEEIVPLLALPPGTPFTCHVTLVFEVPVTLA
jgi:predicted polyphosphate/ATP-dependent NAD kinase